MVDKQIVDTRVSHPMEDAMDIEPGSTIMPVVERLPEPLIEAESYDDKDEEIEEQFQEVYEAAMTAFDTSSATVQTVEPKYRARNEEVAVQYLNTALSAAKEKATMKSKKDDLDVKKGKLGPGTVNNNLIIADRNELLKQLAEQDS